MENAKKEHIIHGTEKMNIAIYDHPYPFKDDSFNAHWHKEFELIYVCVGALNFELEGMTYLVHANQALMINRNIIHSCTAPKKQTGRYVCIVFGEKFLFQDPTDFLYEKYFLAIHKNEKSLPTFISGENIWEQKILSDTWDLINSYFNKEPAYDLNLRVKLLSVFYTILNQNALDEVKEKSSSYSDAIRNMLVTIQQNCTEPVSVKSLAEGSGICPEYFCRLFKSIVGKSPKEYIMSCRFEHAVSLLTENDESIALIALKSGFEDINYFSRYFKKITDMTPSEYRKKYQ